MSKIYVDSEVKDYYVSLATVEYVVKEYFVWDTTLLTL